MKKRRSLLAAFLLVSSVIIGVGYAAVSQTLEFKGRVGATATNEFDVSFKDYQEQNETTFCSLVGTLGPRYAELSFTGFTKVGDTSVVHLSVINNTPQTVGLSAQLGDLPAISSSSEYFNISCAWGDGQPRTIASGETSYIVVTVKLVKPAIDPDNLPGTSFDVSFSATATYTN